MGLTLDLATPASDQVLDLFHPIVRSWFTRQFPRVRPNLKRLRGR